MRGMFEGRALFLLAILLSSATAGAQSAADYNDKGTQAYKASNFQEAVTWFERALELAPDNDVVRRNLCNALQGLAQDLARADDFVGAVAQLQRAVAADPQNPSPLVQIGAYYLHVGDFSEAIRHLEKSVKLEPGLSDAHEVLGGAYYTVGDYGKAELHLRQALDIRQKVLGEEHPDYATSLNELGMLYYKMTDYGKAEPLVRQALDICQKVLGEEHPDYARNLSHLALVYQAMGDYGKAKSLYRQALEIQRKVLGEEHPDYATSLHNLAFLYYTVADYGKAEPLYRRAIEIRRKVRGQEDPSYAQSIWNLAGLLVETNRLGDSLPLFEQALAAYEATRGRIETEEFRRSFQGTMEYAYAMAAAAYKKTGDMARCFETVERGRAKGLMDLLATRAAGMGRLGDTTQVAAVEAQLNRLREEQVQVASAPAGEKTRAIEEVRARSSALEQQRLALVEEKTRLDPELGSLLTVTPPKLDEIQRMLDPGMLLVEYFHACRVKFQDGTLDELWIFVIGRDAWRCVSVPVAQEELREAAQAYASQLADSGSKPAEAAALSAKLHGWLVAPIAEDLAQAQTAVVVPWDVLYYVPFGSLALEGGEPLSATKQVVVSPSAGVYRYVLPKRASNHANLLALGNPRTPQAPLQEAEREARAIAALFGDSEVLLQSDATETAVRSWVRDADVVHLACHGILNEKLPQFSHLLLTADEQNDGKLEMHEIFGLDWSGVSLVTLSACSSGTGKLGAGNDIIGLTRGFMFAGAPSVLATLWEVDDESTRLFMEEFYRQYTSGKSKPESFQIAQNKLRTDPKWSHPYFWAPFVLWGDWR